MVEKVNDIYVKPYQKLFDYVNAHSGEKITNVHDLIEFYFIISTEVRTKLKSKYALNQ